MASLERILVPTDFSAGSHAALAYAVFLGARLGAVVEVLHIYEQVAAIDPESIVQPPGAGKPQTLATLLRTTAEEKLRVFLSDVPGSRNVELRGRVETGAPAEVIVRVAQEEGVDLISMGTKGGGPLSRLLVGSVLEKVIRDAPCPVLAVRVKER